jgi:DNA-binding winged helix-turn-helix (wHTH) protein/tetratricopeptide (TPR) repeat protein
MHVMKKRKAKTSPSDDVPLWFDEKSGEFGKGEERLRLSRKPFAMLRLLVERRPHWVSKDDFYQAIWQPQDEDVMDWTFTTYVHDIRKALGDEGRSPRYIETGTNKGYRFIGPLVEAQRVSQEAEARAAQPRAAQFCAPFIIEPQPQPPLPYVVGRAAELKRLHKLLDRALAGERQLAFVSGESGIGKTTLVRTFLREVATQGAAVIGRGQCIEHYGQGEAYLPVLEAIGRLARGAHGKLVIRWMNQYTPTWLAQMPTLLTATELEEVQHKVQGATRERMLREMSEGIEVFTEQIPFILVLEDLHWSDVSTLDLLSSLARRTEFARLFIIGTYRPEEGLAEGQPLRAVTQELQGHQLCQDIALKLLNEAEVREYLHRRFATATLPSRLPEALYLNTDGSPLFLTAVVDDLLDREVITKVKGRWVFQGAVDAIAAEVPVSIRQLLTRQIDRLNSQEQRIVEAASVAGQEFSCAAVAAAAEMNIAEVEERCEALARRQHFLFPAGYGEWPDGTQTGRYRFHHALYQYLWNERISVGQRQQFHMQIGERLEQGYGGRAQEIAAELAVHFEEGRDYERAIRYMQLAARNALQRSAHAEAANLLAKGITLLKTLPETPQRTQQELLLLLARGGPLIATKGYGAREVEMTYARAFELCRQSPEKSHLLQAQQGLAAFYSIRGQFQKARHLGEQCLISAQQMGDPSRLLQAEWTLGQALFHLGDFVAARQHVEHALTLYDPRQHRSRALQDLGVTSHSYLAWGFWFLGYPEQALATNHKALTLAQELSHSFSVAYALIFATGIYQFCGDGQKAQEMAEKAMTLCREQSFPMWLAFGEIFRGWTLVRHGREEEGTAQILQGLAAWKATGAEASRPLVLAMLAEAYGRVGKIDEGLSALEEALTIVRENEERYYEAELYRLKGELLLNAERGMRNDERKTKKKVRDSSPIHHSSFIIHRSEEAEECFLKAIAIARHQSMKSLELRAVMSLSRLWKQQGKAREAKLMLAEIYGWFSEGFATADLKMAKALLDELAKESFEQLPKCRRRTSHGISERV